MPIHIIDARTDKIIVSAGTGAAFGVIGTYEILRIGDTGSLFQENKPVFYLYDQWGDQKYFVRYSDLSRWELCDVATETAIYAIDGEHLEGQWYPISGSGGAPFVE